MEKLQKMFLTIGIVLSVLIPVWIFLIVPELEKVPSNFNEEILYNGQVAFLDLEKDEMSKPNIFIESVSVTTRSYTANTLNVETSIKAFDAEKNVVFQADFEHEIDRKTKKHSSGNYDGMYFRFPKSTEKRNYKIKDELFFSVGDMIFSHEEKIDNLDTYVFDYDIEPVDISQIAYSESTYLQKGMVFSRLSGKMWVESVTGKIVKREHNWRDCYKDGVCVNIGTTFYSKDTVANQVQIAQNEKQQIILYEIIIPILLIVIALAFLIVAYIGRKEKNGN